MKTVRKERTGWRDEKMSLRHRFWGFNCPAVDLDFVLAEFHLGKPVAIIEYKHVGAKFPDFKHPSYRALEWMADECKLPFFVVFYDNTLWWFKIFPVNKVAKRLSQTEPGRPHSEKEFVTGLYRLRGLKIKQEVLSKLSDYKPAKKAA